MKKQKNASNQSALVQDVAKQIKQIDYDFSNFTIPGFARWVASKRGMEIHIEAYEAVASPAGFWFTSDDGAHLKYSNTLSPTLQIITILHELMHIYLGHETQHIPFDHPLLECYRGAATRDPSKQDLEDQEAESGALLVYQRYLDASNTTDPVITLFGKLS